MDLAGIFLIVGASFLTGWVMGLVTGRWTSGGE